MDDPTNDATVVCISGANTCIPFTDCNGTSDPIALTGGSIGNAVANDSAPCLGGTLNACDNNACCFTCIAIKGCYFGDGSQLTGVSSVPGCYSGDCTIIGCNAGGNIAEGASRVVLYGSNSGYTATTPSNVVAIGTYAAQLMTTATDQVFVGTFAGRCVLTCAGNTAVGAWSFYSECAGTYNTVIGNCAGFTQSGATTNTFIGALAGALDSSGSGNVFIGYKAGCANTTGSCCLVIGNGTCDLITGDFNGGCVGIGTATPLSSLHVAAAAENVGTIIVSSSLAGLNCWNGIEFGYATTRKAGIFFERTCNNYVGKLHFATENTQDASEVALSDAKMTIDEAGFVGIGTATPGYQLEVNSSTVNNVALFESTDSTAYILIKDNSSTTDDSVRIGTIGDNMYLNTKTSNSDIVFEPGNSELMRLDSSAGGVGIGTDAPAGILEIECDQNALTRVYFDNNTAGTSAGAGLLVESDSATIAVTSLSSSYTTSNQYTANAGLLESSGAGGLNISQTVAAPIRFYQNSAEVAQIDSSGNVCMSGIIKNTADDKGYYTGASDDLRLYHGSGASYIYNATGNLYLQDTTGIGLTMSGAKIGIGTTAPDNLLTVQGDTNVADGYGLIVGYCEQNQMSVQVWETQILGTAAGDSGMALFAFATGNGPSLNFLRSRGATIGTQTMVCVGDSLGEISWYGSDGGDFGNPGATLEVVSSGTPAANDMPASMVFSTNRTTTTVTEAMRIDHYGLVGIGTTVPDGILHVFSGCAGSVSADAGGNELVLENSDHVGMSFLSPNDKSAYIFFGDQDCDEVGMITYGHSSNNLDFYVNDAHAMRINSSGEVGIGTTTPTVALDVVGYGKFHGGSGYATPTVALCGGAGPGIEFELTGTGANTWFLGMENNDGNIYLKDGSTDILTVTTTMLHIGCNTTIWGNLGIGTDVADVELHIETATTYAAAQIESTASNGVPYLRFKNDAVTLGYLWCAWWSFRFVSNCRFGRRHLHLNQW